MVFGKRLQYLRESEKMSREELALKLNISYSAISKYETGLRKPDYETIQNLADLFHVTTDYLLGRTDNPKPKQEILLDANPTVIPLLGTIRSDIPILAEENWEYQVEIPFHIKADFALRVEGDSMSWVGIHPGDLALFKRAETASHGQIVATGLADVEWKASPKFYCIQNGQAYLRSANPHHPDIEVTANHRIIGVLVHVIKEAPSLSDYESLLSLKNLQDDRWTGVIHNAVASGISPEHFHQLIEMQKAMLKNMKQ